ncbi:hypothetical protein ACSLOG_22985, partial [Escherichia coli]|uniref:hypothetical protein n=1 Tax=Escherichia coli TaxID=562 RepID=UPI003EDED0B9
CFINHPFSPCDGVRMHPLTHPLPVTEHVSLLDVGYLTPARATNSGLNSKKTDAKSVFLRPDSDLLSNECPTLNSHLHLSLHLHIR